MIVAGGLDYGSNIVAGRWLKPVDFGVFVSVTAMIQVCIVLSIAIRMVVAVHTAELAMQGERQVGAFVRSASRGAWQWGLLATGFAALTSPLVAPLLQLSDAWPLWAGSLMMLPLFAREMSFGALQGVQAFAILGLSQLGLAFLRLVLCVGLILAGGRAVGAILAQPLSCAVGAALMLWWLNWRFSDREPSFDLRFGWSFSLATMVGLAALALMTNLDALFVKFFFSPEVAGNYGPVVTLERISLFLPWAIGFAFLPKVVQSHAAGNDARPLLLLALAAAMAPGLGLTCLYVLFPGLIVTQIFTDAYSDPGIVLGLASLAATLYGGINIWLNYAVSLKRYSFILVLAVILGLQAAGMYLLGKESLVQMALAMVVAGLLGNLAGLATTWSPQPVRTLAAR